MVEVGQKEMAARTTLLPTPSVSERKKLFHCEKIQSKDVLLLL